MLVLVNLLTDLKVFIETLSSILYKNFTTIKYKYKLIWTCFFVIKDLLYYKNSL